MWTWFWRTIEFSRTTLSAFLTKVGIDIDKPLAVSNVFGVNVPGPCTNEGRDLKSAIPEILNTGCNTCTDKQKRNSRKVILHIEEKKPQDWAKIEKKFDPTGELTKAFKKNTA